MTASMVSTIVRRSITRRSDQNELRNPARRFQACADMPGTSRPSSARRRSSPGSVGGTTRSEESSDGIVSAGLSLAALDGRATRAARSARASVARSRSPIRYEGPWAIRSSATLASGDPSGSASNRSQATVSTISGRRRSPPRPMISTGMPASSRASAIGPMSRRFRQRMAISDHGAPTFAMREAMACASARSSAATNDSMGTAATAPWATWGRSVLGRATAMLACMWFASATMRSVDR